jgi:glycosyltransferase involved in cell wall biosynthesis
MQAMRVAVAVVFSHDAFFQRYGGVSRCVVELMRHLDLQGHDWRAFAGRYGSHFLRMVQRAGQPNIAGSWSADAPDRIIAGLRNEPKFFRFVSGLKDVVVHRSYYPVIDLLPARVRVVVTLHDMYWEASGANRSLRFWLQSRLKRNALARADRIVCISHFTLDELTRYWPEFADKAEVIYHGVTAIGGGSPDKPTMHDRFIFVGDRGNRKNFEAAVAGLARSGLERHELLCVGGGAFSANEQAMIERYGLSARVSQSTADDETLAAYYSQSTALIYPSSYEGFGMPLLEAMIQGCPVIAARASCLPEIGGDAAIYADPYDHSAWGTAMRDICAPTLRAKMIARGRERAKAFTWPEIAKRYAAVYRQLLMRG